MIGARPDCKVYAAPGNVGVSWKSARAGALVAAIPNKATPRKYFICSPIGSEKLLYESANRDCGP